MLVFMYIFVLFLSRIYSIHTLTIWLFLYIHFFFISFIYIFYKYLDYMVVPNKTVPSRQVAMYKTQFLQIAGAEKQNHSLFHDISSFIHP